MIRAFIKYYREERAKQKDAKEKAAVARAFNDRYCYRARYVETGSFLPGRDMYGLPHDNCNRWMCPECNRIHAPISINGFTGLCYPRCCSRFEGHRLHEGIRHQ